MAVESSHPELSEIPLGLTVDVYRNLQHGGLSVVDRSTTDRATYGKVIARVPAIYLRDVSFESYEGRRENTVETGRKNVHAFLRGEVTPKFPLDEWTAIHYTVSRPGCWYASGERVECADNVRVATSDTESVKAVGVKFAP